MSHVRFVIAACISACLAGGLVLAQGPDFSSAVTIEIPGTRPDVVSLQTAGAWPLAIRMTANDPMGIGTYMNPPQFPVGSQQGFIVFADPDGCFSLDFLHDPALLNDPCPAADETYLEFTPTINLPNLVKFRVDNVPAARLGAAPILKGWTTEAKRPNNVDFVVGPGVGASDRSPCDDSGSNVGCDNYGYGASPNLPGLVILSDRGVGLVWDSRTFNLVQPRTARNLAGFINSVTWTLNDCMGSPGLPDNCDNGRAGVTAHMNVPYSLFTPVVRIDFGGPIVDHSDPPQVIGNRDRWYQIDGGPWVKDNNEYLRNVLDQMVTTLRVFVVSGRGPSTLGDLNRDSIVDYRDAEQAGYTLLSAETLVMFRTLHQEEEAYIGIPFDRDGNGMQFPPLPAGGGGVNPIPR